MGDLSEPVLEGTAASDYERYLRTDELLALQKGPGEFAHRDEVLFQVVHQSSELWLKLASFEIETAAELVAAQDSEEAARLVGRATLAIRLITDQLMMLERLCPWEYTEVRRVLGHGSGFDSPGFNRLRDAAPLLGEAFSAELKRRRRSLVDVYTDRAASRDLYDLAEILVDLDQTMTAWRVIHVKVVQRIIGRSVVGTQGTPVEVLEKLTPQRLYPELWDVRDQLTELSPPS